MQPEVDRDIRSAVARAVGALVGLGLVLAAVSPTKGVSPRPGSGALAPAQIEVQAIGAGEFDVNPLGNVLEATAFPPPGERGGPSLSVTVRNITGQPLKISVRLLGLSPTLDKAVKVRGSLAGAVVLNGPLGNAAEWSRPSGVLGSGEQSTLRMRFKLLPGLPADSWRGRLDVRQLEFRAAQLNGAPTADDQTVASTTAPTTVPGASTPVVPQSPADNPGIAGPLLPTSPSPAASTP